MSIGQWPLVIVAMIFEIYLSIYPQVRGVRLEQGSARAGAGGWVAGVGGGAGRVDAAPAARPQPGPRPVPRQPRLQRLRHEAQAGVHQGAGGQDREEVLQCNRYQRCLVLIVDRFSSVMCQ